MKDYIKMIEEAESIQELQIIAGMIFDNIQTKGLLETYQKFYINRVNELMDNNK